MEEHYEKETCSIAGSSADSWYDCLWCKEQEIPERAKRAWYMQ